MFHEVILDEQTLEKLANSKRFLKKNHLQKIENIYEHIDNFTLTMKDEDLEYEWRLDEIHQRKMMTLSCSIAFLISDFFWTFLLSEVNFTGKAIKIILDLVIFLCFYQIFMVASVKKNNTVREILNQNNTGSYTKQEIIQLKLTQQRESQRQFFWYMLWWFFFTMHMCANDLQMNFETKISELSNEEAILQTNTNHFMIGVNLLAAALALNILDIHWILMGQGFTVFGISTTIQVYKRFPHIMTDFILVGIIFQFMVFSFSYKRIKNQKSSFLKSKKIQSLLKEQMEIFQHLPDGAIIHRNIVNNTESEQKVRIIPNEQITIEIRHLNFTFQKMFNRQRKSPQRHTQYDSQQEYQDDSEKDTNFREAENEDQFLNSVYLQKSPYKINGKTVEQIEDQPFCPIKFVDAIKEFESGQVYSVLYRDNQGNFNQVDQTTDEFLVYIVTQEVLFNEEISTITYFKDITFGVLYEQVKAQQQLETEISNALQHKMGTPLQTIIHNCQGIENSLKSNNKIREQIKITKILSKLMICQLKDMQDWKELKAGKFRKVSEKFLLTECLTEIYEMTSIKANLKKLTLDFKVGGKFFPTWVIGDRIRFQKIALNLTSNAVENTTQGKITISVAYHKQSQQLYFEVKDTGKGIKPRDQKDFLKMFKSSKQIGKMGLSISKEIALKYNGKLSFTTEYLQGSTFSFTFDLEMFSTQLFDSKGNITLGKNLKDIQKQIISDANTFNNENEWRNESPPKGRLFLTNQVQVNGDEIEFGKIYKNPLIVPKNDQENQEKMASSLAMIEEVPQQQSSQEQEVARALPTTNVFYQKIESPEQIVENDAEILKSDEIQISGTQQFTLTEFGSVPQALIIQTQSPIQNHVQHFTQKGILNNDVN